MWMAPTCAAIAGAPYSGPRSANAGTRDTDSTPPATRSEASPARTRDAASATASMPEAQKRLIVSPGTAASQPAASPAVRARFVP